MRTGLERNRPAAGEPPRSRRGAAEDKGVQLFHLLDIRRGRVTREFDNSIQSFREVDGGLRVGGVVSGDRDSLQDGDLGLADVEGAAFDGVRLGDPLESLVAEVGPQG